MSPVQSITEEKQSRRSVAVGFWSLLLIAMALAGTEFSLIVASGIMFIVAMLSGLSVFILNENSVDRKSSSAWARLFPVIMSISISLGWAVLLSWRNPSTNTLVFSAIGLFPVVIASIAKFPALAVASMVSVVREIVVESETPSDPVLKDHQLCAHVDADAVSVIQFDPSRDDLNVESVVEADVISPEVTQWIRRSNTLDGEIMKGGVRVEFADGQRDATVHISFCPPFTQIPEMDVEDLDAADLEIRIAAMYSFGARLTVRRSKGPNRELASASLRVGFVAVYSSARRAA